MNGVLDSAQRPRLTLKRFIAQLAVGIIGGGDSGMLVLLVAAMIGGNLAPNVEFAGNRGYEATGGIGFLVGLILGTPTLVYRFSRRGDATGRYLPTSAGSALAAALVGGTLLGSSALRLDNSLLPLTGLTALGATVGYNIPHRPARVAAYAAGVVVLIVAGWGYTLYRERFTPAVTFNGDLKGGSIVSPNAVGDQGTAAHTAFSLPGGQVIQEGVAQSQFRQCVPTSADQGLTEVNVRGQYFKPDEAIRIEAHYIGANCASVFLSGAAHADAHGSFAVDLAPDPVLNAPASH